MIVTGQRREERLQEVPARRLDRRSCHYQDVSVQRPSQTFNWAVSAAGVLGPQTETRFVPEIETAAWTVGRLPAERTSLARLRASLQRPSIRPPAHLASPRAGTSMDGNRSTTCDASGE